jgi:hypothetical protein
MIHHSVFYAQDGSPEHIVDQCVSEFVASQEPVANFIVVYAFAQYWLEGEPKVELQAFYELCKIEAGSGAKIDVRFSVSQFNTDLHGAYQGEGLADFCAKHVLPFYDASLPAPLKTVSIAKPWGQEIWYTGVESRGVASLVGINGLSEALPVVVSALPIHLAGVFAQSLILLKILDPLPQEVMGDLYFELHEEKREVYVVTAVAESAWPDGVGAIRFGFDQGKIEAHGNERAFKSAFIASVKAYEATRREIDDLLDEGLLVTERLHSQEHEQRQLMNSFTYLMPLQVGDVVKVPRLTPHSLQHGVRTVEFQTPVYERLIVSFAQKVLTQSHWDTDRAASLMTMTPNMDDEIELLDDKVAVVERIVDFDDFEVRRYTLAHGQSVSVAGSDQYCLLMSVMGDIQLGSLSLKPEQAAFAPKSWSGTVVVNESNGPYCFLVAYPK